MDNSKTTLGQKIRKYRLRSGKSQLELELETGLSTGTISRIENDSINPTKETLGKLIEVLNLSGIESANLFDIELPAVPRLISLTNDINNATDLKKILQISVDEIAKDLNLHGALIALKDGDLLKAMTVTNSWFAILMTNLIGKSVNELCLVISNTPQNLFVKAMETHKSYTSNDLYDFSAGTFPKSLTPIVQKATKHGSGIVFPLLDGDVSIGGIMFTKSYFDNFDYEFEILEAFAEAVSKAIVKVRSL